MHKLFEHLDQQLTLLDRQRLEDALLRRLHGRLDVVEQLAPRRRDRQQLGAAVLRARHTLDQLLALEAADHVADRRAVYGDDVAERGLVDAGIEAYRQDRRILHRRDVEALRLV